MIKRWNLDYFPQEVTLFTLHSNLVSVRFLTANHAGVYNLSLMYRGANRLYGFWPSYQQRSLTIQKTLLHHQSPGLGCGSHRTFCFCLAFSLCTLIFLLHVTSIVRGFPTTLKGVYSQFFCIFWESPFPVVSLTSQSPQKCSHNRITWLPVNMACSWNCFYFVFCLFFLFYLVLLVVFFCAFSFGQRFIEHNTCVQWEFHRIFFRSHKWHHAHHV